MIDRLYVVANALILGGFALMCQPFGVELYAVGFPVLVAGVALHVVLDHVPARKAAEDSKGRSE